MYYLFIWIQIKFLTKTFPWADVIAVNEGELSFNSIIRRLIAGKKEDAFKEPKDDHCDVIYKNLHN